MKKQLSRMFAFMLVACLMLVAMPLGASAAEIGTESNSVASASNVARASYTKPPFVFSTSSTGIQDILCSSAGNKQLVKADILGTNLTVTGELKHSTGGTVRGGICHTDPLNSNYLVRDEIYCKEGYATSSTPFQVNVSKSKGYLNADITYFGFIKNVSMTGRTTGSLTVSYS